MLEDERKDVDGAEKAYRAAIEADPGNAKAHNNLGWLLLSERHDLNGADAEYSAALEIDPSYALAGAGRMYTRACMDEQNGQELAQVAEQYDGAAARWAGVLGSEHEAAVMATAAAARVRTGIMSHGEACHNTTDS